MQGKTRQEPRSRTIASWLVAVGMAVALGISGLGTTSCGGGGGGDGGDDDSGGGSATVEELREAAEEARQTAEDAGAKEYLAADFEKAVGHYDKGVEAEEDGKERTARQKFRYAASSFQRLEKKATDAKTAYEDAVARKAEAEAARKEAEEKEAHVNAKRQFEEVVERFEKAVEYLESKDPNKVSSAGKTFERIVGDFEMVLEVAKENKVVRDKALAEKEAMARWKSQAEEVEAEKYATQDILFANQQIRSADTDFENGDYSAAFRGYQMAAQAYATAITSARQQKELAEAVNQQPSAADASGTPTPSPTPTEPEVGVADVTPTPGGSDLEPATGGLPPGLSGEDLIIAENIGLLLPSLATGTSTYDPTTGEVVLDYTNSGNLKKDLLDKYTDAGVKAGHLSFKDLLLGDSGSSKRDDGPTPPGGGGRSDPVSDLELSFHGHTGGFFLLPIPLEDRITIEFTLSIWVMDRDGATGPILLSGQTGANSYWTDFATVRRIKDGRVNLFGAVIHGDRKKSPNYWFDKTRAIPMRIELAEDPKDAERRRVFVYYDDEEKYTGISGPIPADQAGFIGWKWSRTKFDVRGLKIRGQLSKKFALEMLEEKGIDITVAEAEPEEDVPPIDEGGEGPTTPPSGDAGGDGDFDF